MNDVYSILSMTGYKINELPNGYCIVKRPDENRSLFDNDGKVIINNARNIVALSDFYYMSIDEKRNERLFNKYGELVDGETPSYIETTSKYIKVVGKSDNRLNGYNLYDKHGKVQFKGIKYDVKDMILYNGKYNVIFADKDGYLCRLDEDNNYTKLPIRATHKYNSNNNYIRCMAKNLITDNIADYDGNEIVNGSKYTIDTTYRQSRNVLFADYSKDKFKVIEPNVKTSASIDIQDAISVDLTSEPNILYVVQSVGSKYLLNIDTMQKSSEYRDINKEWFICENLEGFYMCLVLLDRNTLKPIAKIDKLKGWQIEHGILVVTQEVDNNIIQKNYTLEFRELIHEFTS